MTDLTPMLNQAQIAFGIAVIALVLVYQVFYKKPVKSTRSKKK